MATDWNPRVFYSKCHFIPGVQGCTRAVCYLDKEKQVSREHMWMWISELFGRTKLERKSWSFANIFLQFRRLYSSTSEEGYFLSIGWVLFLYLKTTLPFWTWGNGTGERSKFWWKVGKSNQFTTPPRIFFCVLWSPADIELSEKVCGRNHPLPTFFILFFFYPQNCN